MPRRRPVCATTSRRSATGKGDALLVVDMVTSLGGIEVEVDAWGVDVAYSGTQKCLGVPPGLAPLTVADRARERIVEQPSSWYFDLNLLSRLRRVGGRSRSTTTRRRWPWSTPCTPGSESFSTRVWRRPGPATRHVAGCSRTVSCPWACAWWLRRREPTAAVDDGLGPRRPPRGDGRGRACAGRC